MDNKTLLTNLIDIVNNIQPSIEDIEYQEGFSDAKYEVIKKLYEIRTTIA